MGLKVSEDSWKMDSDSNADKYCIPDSASMQYNGKNFVLPVHQTICFV